MWSGAGGREAQAGSGGGGVGQGDRLGVAAGWDGRRGHRLEAVVGLAEHRRQPVRERAEHEREAEGDPPDAGRAVRRESTSTATHPPKIASTPIHVVARRRSPRPATRPTTAPAPIASSPPRSTLSLPPSTIAPTSVSKAPTATKGVAAPS